MRNQVAVFYASQMGAAKEMAGRSSDDLNAAGIQAVEVDFEGYGLEQLQGESILLIVASTWGEGEPPDNSEEFYTALAKAGALDLSHIRYAVLALGDSSYEHFCKHGRDLDELFAKHGALRLRDRIDCDCDEQERYPVWIAEMTALIKETSPAVALR